MGNEKYIQNSELQSKQMQDENEVFNSFINIMVQIVEKLSLIHISSGSKVEA